MSASANNRNKILDAAESLFLHDGFNGATFEKIALQSGLGVIVARHNFGKKPGLAAAVLDRVLERLADATSKALAAGQADVKSDLRSVISNCLMWPKLYPHFGKLIGNLEPFNPANWNGRSLRLQRRLALVLAGWAAKRAPKEIVSLSPSQLYAVMLGPAMIAVDAGAEPRGAGGISIDWVEVLTEAATAALTPRKALRKNASGPPSPAARKR